MVKATFEIPENENRVLNIVKGRNGFSTKEQAFIFIVKEYEMGLELELRPEFIKEMEMVEKQVGIPFKNIDELRNLTGESNVSL